MSLVRWVLLYLATGPSFTRWAILAFYGGGVIALTLAIFCALAIGFSAVSGFLL